MNVKPANTVAVTPEAIAEARAKVTPELLAWLDGQTDADVAARIKADPDGAPELTREWFERARRVVPASARAAE